MVTKDKGQTVKRTTFMLDNLIKKLLQTSMDRMPNDVSEGEIVQLCDAATSTFRKQASLIELQPPINIVGDIHGQFTDLLRIFATLGNPAQQQYLFLGDYVDRGPQSMETIMLLFCYKVKYPDKFILLRGNHECPSVNSTYGFKAELERRFAHANAASLFTRFNDVFSWMPFAALIDNKMLCMHGGISDKLISVQQLRDLRRPQLEPQNPSLELDLLWADPMPNIKGVKPNPRGASVLFGDDVVLDVCRLLGIRIIIRAHQFIHSGCETSAQGRVVTVFSAPRYTNQENTGAALSIKEDLGYDVHYFRPT